MMLLDFSWAHLYVHCKRVVPLVVRTVVYVVVRIIVGVIVRAPLIPGVMGL